MRDNQQIILNCIKNYYNQHGYMPSIREVCTLTGYKSTSNVWAAIQSLFDMGELETDNDTLSARAFRLKKEPH